MVKHFLSFLRIPEETGAFNATFHGELWLKILVSCKTYVHDVMLDGKVGWPMEEDRLTAKITNSSCSGSMSSLAT